MVALLSISGTYNFIYNHHCGRWCGGTQPAPIGYNNYRVSQKQAKIRITVAGGAGGFNSNSDNQSPGFNASGYGAGGGGGGASSVFCKQRWRRR